MISKREYDLLCKFRDGFAPLSGLTPEDKELSAQYFIKEGGVILHAEDVYLTEWVLTGKGKDALSWFEERQKSAKFGKAWAFFTFAVPTIISLVALIRSF